jgi:TRAP-type C4-dicarboxylate transport system permease small subunit
MTAKRDYGIDLKSIITPVSKLVNNIGMAFLVLMMLVTTADVVLRAFFNIAVLSPYAFEAVEFMMVLLIFFGLSYCELQKGNINVDLLVERLPAKLRKIIDASTYTLSIGFVALLVWRSYVQTQFVREAGTHSTALGVPIYVFMLVIAFGSFMLWIALVVNLLQIIVGKPK